MSGTYKQLSWQEDLDCVESIGRLHITTEAFSYVFIIGVTFEEEYPLLRLKRMRFKLLASEGPVVTTMQDSKLLQPDNEENLKLAVVLIAPISVSIKVTHDFFFYRSGIFYHVYCANRYLGLNHAVLLVGYGSDPVGGDFWIIQNNWGAFWGESGFAKIARNTRNKCGIAAVPIYSVVANI